VRLGEGPTVLSKIAWHVWTRTARDGFSRCTRVERNPSLGTRDRCLPMSARVIGIARESYAP
jgi:hypothetical protein